MAGCGKSSVGRLLAQKFGQPFIDTDDLIVESQKRPLQEIIDTEGPIGFKRIEEAILMRVDVRNHIIATGGSSIYSVSGMENLKKNGVFILLQASMDVLKKRVGNAAERGLVRQPNQSFEDLYTERKPLYEQYAEIIVVCSHLDKEGVCRKIIEELKQI